MAAIMAEFLWNVLFLLLDSAFGKMFQQVKVDRT